MGKTREMTLAKAVTCDDLEALIKYRDPETGDHIQRTRHYVHVVARWLKKHAKYSAIFDDITMDLLHKSAPFHDIGKLLVPDHILFKPGALTCEEFEEMKTHAVRGANAICRTAQKNVHDSFPAFAGEIAGTHHERWDGTGYPNGMKGEEIPLSGRLMAIADVYDALVSRRVYKSPFTHSQAVAIIANGDGRTMPHHFDPDVLAAFLNQENTFRQIAIEYGELEEK